MSDVLAVVWLLALAVGLATTFGKSEEFREVAMIVLYILSGAVAIIAIVVITCIALHSLLT